MLSNLAHLTDSADSSLVLAVVLGPVERALLVWCAAVDRRVTGRAYLKLCKLIVLDLDCVMRIALACCFYFSGLFKTVNYKVTTIVG